MVDRFGTGDRLEPRAVHLRRRKVGRRPAVPGDHGTPVRGDVVDVVAMGAGDLIGQVGVIQLWNDSEWRATGGGSRNPATLAGVKDCQRFAARQGVSSIREDVMGCQGYCDDMTSAVQRNPFRPGFGRMPAELIGRDPMLGVFDDALADGGGAHFLVSGHRGMGKTVLLEAFTETAQEHGWLVLSENASSRLTERLIDSRIPALMRDLDGGRTTKSHVTGFTAASVGGVTTSVEENYPAKPTLDMALTELLAKAERSSPRGAERPGVALLVDEIEPEAMDAIRELAAGVQHLTSAGEPVVFVGATLAHNKPALMNLPHSTFLRRSRQFELAALPAGDIAQSLHHEFGKSGRDLDPEALSLATGLTGNHPYLVQVIGRNLWDATEPGRVGIEDVRAAVPQIVELMGREFHRPALVELSTRSADFVEALAPMDKPAKVSDIAAALEVSRQRGHELKEGLEAKGILEADREGRVQFTMPFLSDYVLEHGAHHGTTPSNTPTTSLQDLLGREPVKSPRRGEGRGHRG